MINLLPWWARALIVAALLALAAWAVHTYNESLREDGREEVRAAWSAAVTREQAVQDEKADKRRKAQENADAEHAETVARLAADAAAARLARDGVLRGLQRFVAARAQAVADPAAAGGGASVAGGDPLDLLAGLLSRADGEAGELAQYADGLRAAGLTCERYYDAVTAQPVVSSPLSDGPAKPVAPRVPPG